MTPSAKPLTYKPFFTAPDLSFLQRINWRWWLMRLPMVLLAIPAAYGVGAFAHEHLPLLAAFVAGFGFETTYIGAIAMADQQHDERDRFSTVLWWLVNVGAVLASVVSNLLFVAGGQFANVLPETWAHALPMPVLGFLYGLLLHRQAEKAAIEERAHAAATAFPCKYCGEGFRSKAAMYGHYRNCKSRP